MVLFCPSFPFLSTFLSTDTDKRPLVMELAWAHFFAELSVKCKKPQPG